MRHRICCGIVLYCFLLLGHDLFSQITLEGVVTDTGSEPIFNALVELIDKADANRIFSDYTGEDGRYRIQIGETAVDGQRSINPDAFRLFQNYPNPFNPSTVIAFELPCPSEIRIGIYNTLGQRVKALFDGFHSERTGRIVWDATDDSGRGVPAGVYIYVLNAKGIRIHRKMLLLDGCLSDSNLPRSQPAETGGLNQGLSYKLLSDVYILRVTGRNIETYEQQNLEITTNMVLNVMVMRVGTVTDIDGNTYRTVKIGDQWWMAENLIVTHYCNGDPIPNISADAWWNNTTTGAYCNYYNSSLNSINYGSLYNWYAVKDSRKIAPQDWRVPTDEEWKELEMFLGMSQTDADAEGWRGVEEGGKLKETGTLYWYAPNTGATNETGFSARASGYRDIDGFFLHQGRRAGFWTSSQYMDTTAWSRYLYHDNSAILRQFELKQNGFSIRCIRGE